MEKSYNDIRNNIYTTNEEYLKRILLDFYNQSLDSTDFKIEK